jgi:O-antigen ligase
MAEIGNGGSGGGASRRTPFKGILLSILMTILLGGALPLCFLLLGRLTWLFWCLTGGSIALYARELPLGRLLRPVLPYLAWLCFYLVWGLIIAPVADYSFAAKTLATTLVLAFSMAILTSRPESLRTLASAAQLAVVGNLLVLVLMIRYPGFAQMVGSVSSDVSQFGMPDSRFGGLWGNPNMAGYVCLVVTVLSVFAQRLLGWLGRLSCLPLLYLTSSRKSVILYLLITLLYLFVVQRRNAKFWVVAVTAVTALVLAFALSSGLQATTSRMATRDPHLLRLMDVEEKDTAEAGGQTRVDLFKDWLTVASAEPWYGYGLQAMAGDVLNEKDPTQVVTRGVFPTGTHNTYLGIWIDVGPVGFFTFLLMLAHYAKACLFSRGSPTTRWALLSLLICNLVILFVSHDHLFSFEGKCAFVLFFLLPGCPALHGRRRWLAQRV